MSRRTRSNRPRPLDMLKAGQDMVAKMPPGMADMLRGVVEDALAALNPDAYTPGNTRTCGECTRCCTHLRVDEIAKPDWTPCKHLCAKGCGVYESRPPSCRVWRCVWLQGYFGEGARPDKIGVVVTPKEEGNEFVIIGGTPVIIVSCEDDVMSEMYGSLLAMAIVGRRGGVAVLVGLDREGMAMGSRPMVEEYARRFPRRTK